MVTERDSNSTDVLNTGCLEDNKSGAHKSKSRVSEIPFLFFFFGVFDMEE
jgi:hypothetical protein